MQHISNPGRRWLLVGVGLAVAALLIWASWEAPARHLYAPALQVLLVEVEGVRTPTQARHLEQQLRAVAGVSACTINSQTGLTTVRYNEDTVPEAEVRRVLSVGGLFRLRAPARVAPGTERQAPPGRVPALERLRFALNLRRLWTSP